MTPHIEGQLEAATEAMKHIIRDLEIRARNKVASGIHTRRYMQQLVDSLQLLQTEVQVLRRELEALLASIHGDDGEYTRRHGWTEATAVAVAKVSALRHDKESRKPLSAEQLRRAIRDTGFTYTPTDLLVARAVERAHGIF